MLNGFADDGGAQSSNAGTSGEGGRPPMSAGGAVAGGAVAGGAGSGGTAAVGGTHTTGGQQAVMGGRQGASSGSGGELLAGNAGYAGQAGDPSACRDEQRFSGNLAKCAQGFVHRARALACLSPAHDDNSAPGAGGSAGAHPASTDCPIPVRRCARNEECQSDQDCASGAYCIAQQWFSFDALMLNTACVFPCKDDTECFDGELCACSPFERSSTGEVIELGVCRSAACKVDADCGPDGLCSAPLDPMPFAPELPPIAITFTCTTSRDECRGNQDCPPASDKSCCAENLCRNRNTGDRGDHLACVRQEHCDACN